MTREDDLIARARELQRLVTKRRRLKRQLKVIDGDIKHTRKLLLAIKHASEDRRPDVAPDRLFAGVVGMGVAHLERIKCECCGEPAGEGGALCSACATGR